MSYLSKRLLKTGEKVPNTTSSTKKLINRLYPDFGSTKKQLTYPQQSKNKNPIEKNDPNGKINTNENPNQEFQVQQGINVDKNGRLSMNNTNMNPQEIIKEEEVPKTNLNRWMNQTDLGSLKKNTPNMSSGTMNRLENINGSGKAYKITPNVQQTLTEPTEGPFKAPPFRSFRRAYGNIMGRIRGISNQGTMKGQNVGKQLGNVEGKISKVIPTKNLNPEEQEMVKKGFTFEEEESGKMGGRAGLTAAGVGALALGGLGIYGLVEEHKHHAKTALAMVKKPKHVPQTPTTHTANSYALTQNDWANQDMSSDPKSDIFQKRMFALTGEIGLWNQHYKVARTFFTDDFPYHYKELEKANNEPFQHPDESVNQTRYVGLMGNRTTGTIEGRQPLFDRITDPFVVHKDSNFFHFFFHFTFFVF